jgi:hypothetical protein
MSVQRRNLDDSAGDVEHLANDERVASYQDEADGGGHRTVVSSAVAAARAPAARREVQLSPAEAAYVTSWRTDSRAEVQERE